MRAVTRALPPGPPIDPRRIAGDTGVFFANDELVLAGTGRAAVLPLAEGLADPAGCRAAVACLAALARDDPLGLPGTGPVAFGALPFEIDAPSALVVPAICYGRAAGCSSRRGWHTSSRSQSRETVGSGSSPTTVTHSVPSAARP